ncbi:MAG TPA: hypothetical protein HPP83_08335 [Candidatus Hydrogenedentes bacterium]|nr:hypothetical protein [Candidatus Hydrogenedentota bacterium]
MLSRKRNDPRWAALADLRTKWGEVRLRLAEYNVRGRCDVAAGKLRTVLAAASQRLHQWSEASGAFRGRVGRRLRTMARETETYLHSSEVQKPTRQGVVNAQWYVSEKLVAGYEEVAIRYVARRRQLNAYRKEVIKRVKPGRILTLNVSPLPHAILFELVLGLRFWQTSISNRT